jgi:hypothetical protein
MSSPSPHAASQAPAFAGIPPGGAYADEAWRFTPVQLLQLQELARLRAVGMARAEEIGIFMNGGQPQVVADALLGRNGIIQAFARVARAVRQIITLEREIAGLCKGPNRDAERAKREQAAAAATAAQGDGPQPLVWSERSDYDNRPLDQVVASVRKVLGADAPEDDPFAPPVARRREPRRRWRSRSAIRRRPMRRMLPKQPPRSRRTPELRFRRRFPCLRWVKSVWAACRSMRMTMRAVAGRRIEGGLARGGMRRGDFGLGFRVF